MSLCWCVVVAAFSNIQTLEIPVYTSGNFSEMFSKHSILRIGVNFWCFVIPLGGPKICRASLKKWGQNVGFFSRIHGAGLFTYMNV